MVHVIIIDVTNRRIFIGILLQLFSCCAIVWKCQCNVMGCMLKPPGGHMSTFFLGVFKQRNVYSVVPLVTKAQSVERLLHLGGSVWAEHIKRIPWMIGHHRVSLPMEKKRSISNPKSNQNLHHYKIDRPLNLQRRPALRGGRS